MGSQILTGVPCVASWATRRIDGGTVNDTALHIAAYSYDHPTLLALLLLRGGGGAAGAGVRAVDSLGRTPLHYAADMLDQVRHGLQLLSLMDNPYCSCKLTRARSVPGACQRLRGAAAGGRSDRPGQPDSGAHLPAALSRAEPAGGELVGSPDCWWWPWPLQRSAFGPRPRPCARFVAGF